ncbi:MAG: hypothetical protein WAW37_03820 [Syntrophobacteraceae bacterium]
MRKISWKMIVTALVLIVAISGCSWKKTPAAATKTAPAASVGNLINIQAGTISFEPTLIKLEKPGDFILQVKNVTGSEQNLTIKNPQGKVIKALNVGPKATAISNVELPDPGSYEFYSDKRFHASMVMKGHIVVGAAK